MAAIHSSGSPALDGGTMLAGQRVPAPTGVTQPNAKVSVNIRYTL